MPHYVGTVRQTFRARSFSIFFFCHFCVLAAVLYVVPTTAGTYRRDLGGERIVALKMRTPHEVVNFGDSLQLPRRWSQLFVDELDDGMPLVRTVIEDCLLCLL